MAHKVHSNHGKPVCDALGEILSRVGECACAYRIMLGKPGDIAKIRGLNINSIKSNIPMH